MPQRLANFCRIITLTHGQAVISSIANRVHWMRSNLVDSIKHQIVLGHQHPKGVTPVPCVILDDSMGIDLDPEIEEDQGPSKHPSKEMHR